MQIDEIGLDEEILSARFSCDLSECKGACCTFPGELGAPLLDEEIKKIKASYKAASKYLDERSIRIIKNKGFFEGKPGSFTTVCINKRDCVFVYYEGDIAFCALEKAWLDGKNKYRKPLSCHLFPIRVGDFGGKYLYYEKIPECKPGVIKGIVEGMSLVESLREPLTRAFGEEWYNKIIETVNNIDESNNPERV